MKVELWFIDDENQFNQFITRGGRVVMITESPEYYLANAPGVATASILLPSYDAVSADIDGDYEKFKNIYLNELSSNERLDYFVSILAALYLGIPIGLYFGPEEREMNFVSVLLEYLYYSFGMIVGKVGSREPYILDQYDNMNLDKIYLMNLISFDIYVLLRRNNISDNPNVWPKILGDIGALGRFTTNEEIVEFLDMLKRNTDSYGYYVPDPLG